MNRAAILSIFFALFTFIACRSVGIGVESKVNSQVNIEEPQKSSKSEKPADLNILPIAVQNCLPKIHLGEPIEPDLSTNPFYLRVDLNGNRTLDHAIRVRGKDTKDKGLLICMDNETPYIFGKIARSNTPLTTIDDDNFLTDDWDVVSNEEMANLPTYPPKGATKEGKNAKGEALIFAFQIDGVQYVYWDGKNFRSFGE